MWLLLRQFVLLRRQRHELRPGLVASGNTRQQKYGIGFANGAAYTTFDLKSEGNSAGHVFQGWHTNIRGSINGYGGTQERAYTATITPNPTEGNYIVIAPLTGNITINAPSAANSWTGAEFTLQFTQDGTGSRTVSFGAGIRAAFTVTSTANRTSLVTLRYNGTDWMQVSEKLNIT